MIKDDASPPNPEPANSQQANEWNGDSGARWLANQERLDRVLEPFGLEALSAARPQPGERVLDIGCGCGGTTLELARRVGSTGSVSGVDISAPLLGRARERAEALHLPIHFARDDASRHPLEPGAFDLLFSRFGVMFFEDPPAAFSHLVGALKPGGRLAFVCWRGPTENPWLTLPLAAARPFLPPAAEVDPDAPGPFAFARRERLEGILSSAGLRAIELRPFDLALQVGIGDSEADAIEDALAYALQIGPLARLQKDLSAEARANIQTAVRLALAPHAGHDGVRVAAAVWVVTAIR